MVANNASEHLEKTSAQLNQSYDNLDNTSKEIINILEQYIRPAVASDGSSIFLWNGDAGYESGDPDIAGPRNRLLLPEGFGGSVFQYIRSA